MKMLDLDELKIKYQLYLLENNKEAALKIIDELVAADPSPLLYTLQGEIHNSLQHHAEATQSFHKALEMDQQFPQAHKSLTKLNKSETRNGTFADVSGSTKYASQENTVVDTNSHTATVLENSLNSQGTQVDLENDTVLSEATNSHPKKQHTTLESDHFKRYKILQTLGKGGMGVVYKARDLELDRDVALKVIINQESVSDTQLSRFIQEVKTTARLKHPNIVGIHDFGTTPQHYFTMEYIEGKTLSQVIRDTSLSMREIAQIMVDICSGVACAHQQKIIHRDLKPSNIMIDHQKTPKVMDFGLAKLLESQSSLSRTGDVLGTPVYMPPEQAYGRAVNEKSDVYSLGAIGYEMLTKRPPFQGDNVYNILHQVASTDPIVPKLLNPDIATELQTIFLKCLEKSPNRRYLSVAELRQDLQRFLNHEPIQATTPSYSTQISKWFLRNKGFATAITTITVLILVSLVTVSYLYVREKHRTYAQNMINEAAGWFNNRGNISLNLIEQKFTEAKQLAPDYFATYQQLGMMYFQYANNPRVPLFRIKKEQISELKPGPVAKDWLKLFMQNHIKLDSQAQITQQNEEYFCFCEQNKYQIKAAGDDWEIYYPNSTKYYYDKAIKEFEMAIQRNSRDYISMYQLYVIYGSSFFQNYDLTKIYIHQLMSFNPPLNNEYGYFSQGKNLWLQAIETQDPQERQRLFDETSRLYDKASQYNKNFACLDRYKGTTYITSKKYEKAIACFLESIKIDPYMPDTYFDLACLYAWRKDSNNALKYLEIAINRGFKKALWLKEDNIFWQLVRKVSDENKDDRYVWEFLQDSPEFQKIAARLDMQGLEK